jgi:hypothetical protein
MHSHLHKSSAFLMLVQANSAILFFKVAFVSSVQGERAVVKKVLKSVVMSLNFVVKACFLSENHHCGGYSPCCMICNCMNIYIWFGFL